MNPQHDDQEQADQRDRDTGSEDQQSNQELSGMLSALRRSWRKATTPDEPDVEYAVDNHEAEAGQQAASTDPEDESYEVLFDEDTAHPDDDPSATRRDNPLRGRSMDTALLSPDILPDDESQVIEPKWRRPAPSQDDDDPAITPLTRPDSLFGNNVDTAVLRNNLLRGKSGENKIPEGLAGPTDKREIILVIRGMVERRVMKENKPITLGRADMKTRFLPDIDLTPYGALDRGVSREHATLHLDGDRLFVTDLDSTNGTFLSGKRLTPNTATILRKGDELLLGRLPVQVLFR